MADSWGVGSELWNDGCTEKQRDVVSFTAKEALSEEYKYDWRENAIAVKKGESAVGRSIERHNHLFLTIRYLSAFTKRMLL